MLKDIFFQIPPKKPQKNSKLFPNTSILTELCGADNKYHLKVQTDTKKNTLHGRILLTIKSTTRKYFINIKQWKKTSTIHFFPVDPYFFFFTFISYLMVIFFSIKNFIQNSKLKKLNHQSNSE